MKRLLYVAGLVTVAVAVFGLYVSAEPAQGVKPTVLARGTYQPFKVNTAPSSAVDFQAKAKSPLDMVVRMHEYVEGGSTGWHTHPGPVFITVVKGQLTFYEADDPTCTPKVVNEGEGYVDNGHGHLGRNESGAPAIDVSVILAPVGLPFRGELPAPNPYCGF